MNSTPDNLESQLRELTTHRGPEASFWQKALDQSEASEPKPRSSVLSRSLRQPLLLGLAACLVVALGIGVLLPHLGRPRGSMAPTVHGAHERVDSDRARSEMWRATRDVPHIDLSQAMNASQGGGGGGQATWRSDEAGISPFVKGGSDFFGAELQSVGKPAQDTFRHVIQKATIELQAPDVRAVFAKAAHLISAAGGEFVETSSLTGDGKTAQANLTLRVGVARLSEVMNQLRELGQVKSENTTGEDVTSHVVDLEARIRNEQRVEKELLELLDKRADAPLKDILELRHSLTQVRQTIEQYIAQRDRLGRLVSLASILVVIRAEPEAAAEPAQASILSYFTGTIANAWRDGLHAASDSVSWLVKAMVGGVLWWAVLAAIAYMVIRYRRRLAARCV